METRTRYSASKLTTLARCPSAAVTSEDCTDDTMYAGTLGRAFHAVMAYAYDHGLDAAYERVKVEAISCGVDPDELERLVTRFKWDPSTLTARPEVKLELVNFDDKLSIGGVVDLLVDHSENHIEVIDYKTTWRYAEEPEPDEHPQLLAYGLAAWKDRWGHQPPPDARCTLTLAFARLGSEHGWSSWDFYEGDLAWIEDVVWKIARTASEQYEHDETRRDYQSGAWCQYCPGKSVCKALTSDLQGAMNLVGGDVTDVTRENVLGLHALRKSMTRFESALKKRVHELVADGGPIEGDDSVLEFRTSFRRPGLKLDDVTDALLRCGADPQTREAVAATLGMRQKVEQRRLDLYKRRE